MNWIHAIDTWIVIVGVLCAMACALLGNFLVLRRMSMMGDAISHAVLPGLAVAFLVTGERTSLTMFLGAAAVGILTAVFIQWVSAFGRVERGAAMGVVFTTLFAVGLIVIVRGADHVDLDPDCVLYGAIELTPLDTLDLAGGAFPVPRAAVVLGAVLLLNAAFVAAFFKELRISSFDPALATALGINASFMHYALMTLVAVTAVASFEAIGSILVIAMLIVPAAAAHLLTDRLGAMIAVSLVFAAVSAALGHAAAITVPSWFGFTDTTTAGMMASVAGVMFFGVLLLAPRHGVLSKLYHRARLSLRIVAEDVLGLLYRVEEIEARRGGSQHPAAPATSGPTRPGSQGHAGSLSLPLVRGALGVGPITARAALAVLRIKGRVERAPAGYRLTAAGRKLAANLVRTHRLWEIFLHRHLGLAADHLHAPAERLEHVTGPAMQQQLAEHTGHATHDPHGKPLPR